MAQAYSDDLRKKLLKAYLAGQGTLRALASRFDVSVAWAWKISSAHKKSGSMERPPQVRHGRVSRLDVEQVKRLLDAQPDLTLHGLKDALAAAGTTVSPSHLWRVLGRLGYRLKKSRSTPPSVTPKPTDNAVQRSSSGLARSRRNG
jgi:transposase